MSIAISRKKVHCTNCNYDGKSKVVGTGAAYYLIGIILFLFGFYVLPFFFIGPLFFLIGVVKPANHICPICKWENTVPYAKLEKQR